MGRPAPRPARPGGPVGPRVAPARADGPEHVARAVAGPPRPLRAGLAGLAPPGPVRGALRPVQRGRWLAGASSRGGPGSVLCLLRLGPARSRVDALRPLQVHAGHVGRAAVSVVPSPLQDSAMTLERWWCLALLAVFAWAAWLDWRSSRRERALRADARARERALLEHLHAEPGRRGAPAPTGTPVLLPSGRWEALPPETRGAAWRPGPSPILTDARLRELGLPPRVPGFAPERIGGPRAPALRTTCDECRGPCRHVAALELRACPTCGRGPALH